MCAAVRALIQLSTAQFSPQISGLFGACARKEKRHEGNESGRGPRVAALAIPTQGVYGWQEDEPNVDYIVSEDTTTQLKLTVNHPYSIGTDATIPLAPSLTNWTVGGSLIDYNAGLFSAGLDSVTFSGMTVQRGTDPKFTVPNPVGSVTYAAVEGVGGRGTFTLIKYASSLAVPGGTDYVDVAGTLKKGVRNQERPAPVVEGCGNREAAVAGVIVVHGEPDLLQVVGADRPSRSFAGGPHRGHDYQPEE